MSERSEPQSSAETSEQRRRLKATIAALEKRAQALASGVLRHDVGNAIGAARNALALLESEDAMPRPERFVGMVHRNIERAERLLSGQLADAPPPTAADELAGNEGDDLRGPHERDHRDSFGL